ncbi:hypothetical protein PV10_08984 [Exophiala mesophila]|uniref:GST N-terminal domain-containing protein n=1 Tax=Exophiala mesophila TaxID=212818 RepID=A0A0D1Z2D8_EXOME|nr:uncharacterized protein PV10_08984 [Exophiala mesophila]KIV88054.1 hypothetical protein PV10_08984 [Exophiala mesophila]
MSAEIVFFDLPSRAGKAWSLNPWKTRLALNYKGLPYRTEWIEYPDLRPTFQGLGIPPNETGFAYSSPAIGLPDGSYVMESRKIASALEERYPTPSLHLDSPYLPRVEAVLSKLLPGLRPIFVPLVPKVFLNPRSQEYFIPDRERTFGKSLDEVSQGADQAAEDSRPYVAQLAELLRENQDGPFFAGKQVGYADFMVVAFLRMLTLLGAADKLWKEDGEKELKGLYQACEKWLERDSY